VNQPISQRTQARIIACLKSLPANARHTERINRARRQYFDETWEENHRLFHLSLVAACRAPRLLDYRALLYENVDRYRRLSALYERGTRDVDGEHRALVEAVLNRDADGAAGVMQEHLLETTRNLLRNDPDSAAVFEELIDKLVGDIAAGQTPKRNIVARQHATEMS